ncbi:MFS transporter [Kitasatospora sp. Ki12]
MVAFAGVQTAYALDLLTFGASLLLLVRIKAVPPATGAERPSVRAGRAGADGRAGGLDPAVTDFSA